MLIDLRLETVMMRLDDKFMDRWCYAMIALFLIVLAVLAYRETEREFPVPDGKVFMDGFMRSNGGV